MQEVFVSLEIMATVADVVKEEMASHDRERKSTQQHPMAGIFHLL